MERIPLDQAKDRLDELVQRAASGEEIVIADPRSGGVRLQPLKSRIEADCGSRPKRVPGRWKGRIHIPDDKLLEPLTEDELAWISGENSL